MIRFKLIVAFIIAGVVTGGISNAGATCIGATPTWHSTPDRDSLATCVTNAISGDRIIVSSGTATWDSAVIWNSKNLTLIGAGIDRTIIISNAEIFQFGTGENPVANSSRITGFTLKCSAIPATSAARIQVAGRNWRIDNNKFDCAHVTSNQLGVYARGSSKTSQSKGLIDSNSFYNARVLVQDYPGTSQRELNGTNHWSTPLGLGTDEAVYVEDNHFVLTVFGNVVDSNDAGRYVFRFNAVTDAYIEAHGIGNNEYRRGARKWEIYHNILNAAYRTPAFITFLRSGTGIVFNNTATGTFNAGYTIDHRRSYENNTQIGPCNGTSTWDGNNLTSGWLCRDQIGAGADSSTWPSGFAPPTQAAVPAYFFLNTRNGLNAPVEINPQANMHIIPNRSFYDYLPSFDGRTGVGSGKISSRPSTCQVGTGYWAIDEGEWNSLNAGPDGRFYKCSAANMWSLYYTPYTYPHPLRNTEVITPPAQPGGLTAH